MSFEVLLKWNGGEGDCVALVMELGGHAVRGASQVGTEHTPRCVRAVLEDWRLCSAIECPLEISLLPHQRR